METLSSGYRRGRMTGLIFSALVIVGMAAFFLYAPREIPVNLIIHEDHTVEVLETVSKWSHIYEIVPALLGLVCLLLSTEKGRRIRSQMGAPRYYAIRESKQKRQSDAADRFCILLGWLLQIAALLYLLQDALLLFAIPFSMLPIILIAFPTLLVVGIVGAVKILKK